MAWRRSLSPLVLLLLWELAARAHWIDQRLIPAPSTILWELARLAASGALAGALLLSLYRVACGFAIAAAIGIVLGALMARSALVETVFDPLVELLRPVSPLAIFPLAILWFGIEEASKIFIIALACSFPIILNTYAGVRGIDASLFRAARSLGASPAEIFRSVVLPGSLPQIFTGLRLAWGIALIVIVAAEMIGATRGIGYMVLEAQQTFRVERVFAGIFIIGLLGFLTDLGFRRLQRLLLPWHRETRA